MRKLRINGIYNTSEVVIGKSINEIDDYVKSKNIFVVTDKNVYKYYHKYIDKYCNIILEPGEQSKSLDNVKKIYQKLIINKVDRSWLILGFGGGVVTDIAGFVASTFMRGLDFGFVSTSLLSQVDASVGGKNGLNFSAYKNLIGTINQPDFVLCDPDALLTLSEKEFKTGVSEIVKHGIIADEEYFNLINDKYELIKKRDLETLEDVIYKSVVIKSKIVNKDEQEKGIRKLLNFGHTIGHAIEALSDYAHGEAVSIGMHYAAQISVARSTLTDNEVEKIRELLYKFNLPTRFEFNAVDFLGKIKMDKKSDGNEINFVLLEKIGKSKIERIEYKELEYIISMLK